LKCNFNDYLKVLFKIKDIAYDFNFKIISKALNIDSLHSEILLNNGVDNKN
jgi:hypothetical protein